MLATRLIGISAAAAVGLYLLFRRRKASPPPPQLERFPSPPARQLPPALAPSELHILHSGGFAAETAEMVSVAVTTRSPATTITTTSMDRFKNWADKYALTSRDTPLYVVFIAATIENEQPTEESGACVRFFNRRNHPDDMLSGRLTYAVLGLGDSNLLLDRQTTTAKDCNQVAKRLDARLCALGAQRCHGCGMTDDRTDNQELRPWIDSLVKTLYP